MPDITIRLAKSDADFDATRALCHAWVDWQLEAFPERKEIIMTAFEPVSYARTLADLSVLHARPKGAILLAFLNDQPVGCVMYLEMAQGVAEIKRLFVDPAGRGHGLGRALLQEMFTYMRSDGYTKVQFSSARFLVHARHLYESVGFKDIEQPAGVPAKLREAVYFMERAL